MEGFNGMEYGGETRGVVTRREGLQYYFRDLTPIREEREGLPPANHRDDVRGYTTYQELGGATDAEAVAVDLEEMLTGPNGLASRKEARLREGNPGAGRVTIRKQMRVAGGSRGQAEVVAQGSDR